MKNLVIVGTQWGDEGKGKVVDILTPAFDIVARYQGGHNAGHTVIIGDKRFVLHLIPSGILHPDKLCVIGNGVVVDPKALVDEIDQLQQLGITVSPEQLYISNRAHLILPYHRLIEHGGEERRGKEKVGTTMRGIGPAYEDKIGRRGLRAGDLLDEEPLIDKLKSNIEAINLLQKAHGNELVQDAELIDEVLALAQRIQPYIRDTTSLLNKAVKEGKRVLLEGAQATMLDIDFGTYPFVTSSSASAGGACTGTGLAPGRITGVLGIAKAYTTRVGAGPFPTELTGELGEFLRAKGFEYGASTGRPRRCGWFDAFVVRYSAAINGLNSIAMTKLDVLDEFKEIKVCTGYRHNGKQVEDMPFDAKHLEEMEPVYETLPGWQESTNKITEFDQLPKKAREYVDRLSKIVDCEISVVSVGPERSQTIVRPGSLFEEWQK